MNDLTRAYAMLSAQNFLLGQLYARLFVADPQAREHMPAAILDAATYKSHTRGQTTDEALADMQARVVLELRALLADVEQRVRTTLDQVPR